MALFRKAVDKLLKGLKRTKAGVFGTLRTLLSGRQIDAALLGELEMTLIQADIGVKSAMRIIEELKAAHKEGKIEQGDQVIEFLKTELKQYWPADSRAIKFAPSGPTVILVAGINGAGKTTSVAKLAYQFHSEGKKVLLAAADTFRAAAVEQLTIWADRIGCEIVKGSGKDPASVVYEACEKAVAHNADILLVDTAGRLHTQENLMRELTKIRDVVAKKLPGAPHEVLLVLDATTGQNAINQAKAFIKAIDATGIFLAKLDGTAKGGIVVAIRDEVQLPVKFVGLGEKFEDVEHFDPDKFVDAMFE